MNGIAAFKFQPFSPKQLKVLTWWTPASPYRDYDILIADGAVRSGKTVPTVDSFVMWSQATFQHQAFILASRTMGALKRNVLRPLFQMLTAKGVPYRYVRGAEPFVQIGTNTYYCFGAHTEASQDVLQGLTAAGALLDEVALFPENFVEQALARCSVDGAKIFMTCNPEGPFHWLKVNYIDQARKKRILYLHFTMDDNWTLSPKVKERYQRMFFGLWYKRMILGLWVQAEGAIYDMWDDTKHLYDQLPRTPERWWVGVDYGTGNPTAFILVAQIGDDLYAEREYYWDSRAEKRQKTDLQYSQDLRKFLEGIAVSGIFVDPSASSFIAQLRADNVGNIIPADNSVVDGIRTVSSYLSSVKLRVNRNTCAGLAADIQAYVWDAKAQKRGIDAPLKTGGVDHRPDALRYLVQKVAHAGVGELPTAVTTTMQALSGVSPVSAPGSRPQLPPSMLRRPT